MGAMGALLAGFYPKVKDITVLGINPAAATCDVAAEHFLHAVLSLQLFGHNVPPFRRYPWAASLPPRVAAGATPQRKTLGAEPRAKVLLGFKSLADFSAFLAGGGTFSKQLRCKDRAKGVKRASAINNVFNF